MWTFKMPVEIIFGKGCSGRIRDIAYQLGNKVAFLSDKVIGNLSAVKSIAESLEPELQFVEIQPNPTVANVDNAARLLKKKHIEAIVAIGGGSVIDCAKAASFLSKAECESVREFHSGSREIKGSAIPVIAVPTTAGTGSEVTPFAVLDDTEKNFKAPIASPVFYPKAAIVDPELTYSLPAKVTASTGMDALSHAIEGYWSKNHQPICDTLAKESAKLIFENLEAVLENPENKNAREAMSFASLLAGMAFQLPKNALIHACSFPLSAYFHMPHGTACAFVMEEAIRLNAPVMNGRMEEFAAACGFDTIESMINKIAHLKRKGGLPLTLTEAGISKSDIPRIVEGSFHPLINNNPKKVTEDDLYRIFNSLKKSRDLVLHSQDTQK